MRTLFALTVLLVLGMASTVSADGINQVVNPTTVNPQWTVTAFNDTGSTVTSYSVVAWDDDDTDFSTTMYPYFTTTTTADDPYTAGVTLTDCPDQQVCELVVYGPAWVRVADSTDNATVDTLIGTTSLAGQVGDYATGADTCALGTLIAFHQGQDASDNVLARAFININCD